MTTLAPSTSSRPEVEALEDQQQRRHDQDQDQQQQQQRPRQRQQPTQQRQPPPAAAAAAVAADDEREQHHHHRSSPPHSHPPGLPKPAIDASGAAYESFTSPKLPPSSPTALSSSPSVSLLHPHVPPSRPLDHASTVAARFRALSTRLKAPAQHLRWKSSSAIPTLDTTSATPSGSSTPTERPNSASAMTSHDTLNPHSASDLLRQAMMQRAAAEDEHDQIGSNSSTPPGAATPRPDLTDKRLPGILHSYFGQVCDSFRTKKPTNSPAPASSSSPSDQAHDGTQDGSQAGESTTEQQQQQQQQQQQPPLQQQGAGQALSGGEGLPTAPCSPKERREDESPPLLPHERLDAPSRQQQPPSSHHTPSFFYPTPPTSSSSSMHRVSKEEPGDTTTTTTSSGRALSTSEANPPRSRRHTFALTSPLSSILTTPDLPAAHISNPATRRSSQCPLPAAAAAAPRSPSKSSPASRRSSASKSKDLVKKLTEGVSPSQNTPPQTPRTRSHNEKPASVSQTKEKANVLPNGATVAPPKGKLRVSISEGRGLRPSYDPYVVCQFQQSEYISDGPRHDDSDKKDSLARPGAALVMQRTTSDYGRTMAIPMRSRQSSNSGYSSDPAENGKYVTDPTWEHDAIFDVVGDHSEIDISVYDRSNQEAFLGHVRFCPNLVEYEKPFDGWFPLEPREGEENSDSITGEIHLRISFQKSEKRHVEVNDFEILKLIGKGTFGQVFQVRKKDTRRIYAMKVLSKKVIVQKKEVAHTMGERNILVRTATVDSPFIVGLKFSFQTPTDLFLVTDYMSGGELFWHLQKEGRFLEHRAKFYIAELILALQHLHEHDIVYRDLKPENILLDAKGHIALCDFGLSKANLTDNATTNTFCGTTEYLAPEVLLDEHGYTKMVDFWSLGVLVFEMCCGWSPFYAEDTQQMYKNIAFGKVRFPRDALSSEGRSFVKGLLNRNPKHRLGSQRDAEELKEHPFFSDIDWDALAKKNVPPPFKPKLKSEEDVSNFDPEFTNALNGGASSLNARAAALANGMNPASTPLSPTLQNQFKGFTFVDDSAMEKHFRGSDYPEKMEEDDRDDAEWEQGSNRRGERMSGVMHSNDADEGIFNNGGFDV